MTRGVPSELDPVFKALADPTRRRLLERLHERDGQTLSQLCDGLDMTRQSVSQHLSALEAGHLVGSRREGRAKLHHLEPERFDAVVRWLNGFRPDAATAARRSPADASPDQLAYAICIASTPERVWDGLVGLGRSVLDSAPPRRLVTSGSTPGSQVSFDIEPYDDAVRVLVWQVRPTGETEREAALTWAAVLSSLKTRLETGNVPPQEPGERTAGDPVAPG